MVSFVSRHTLYTMLHLSQPDAIARMMGNADNPALRGLIKFYQIPSEGLLIEAEIFHLPDESHAPSSAFFGFHIHENGDCGDAFENTGNHYNPTNTPHPVHSGDLPPLLSNQGYAWMAFYDNRLSLPEILGKSVIIHSEPDDFVSQPSGNAGEKIACGVIRPLNL